MSRVLSRFIFTATLQTAAVRVRAAAMLYFLIDQNKGELCRPAEAFNQLRENTSDMLSEMMYISMIIRVLLAPDVLL